jgi:hypothetical protein
MRRIDGLILGQREDDDDCFPPVFGWLRWIVLDWVYAKTGHDFWPEFMEGLVCG